MEAAGDEVRKSSPTRFLSAAGLIFLFASAAGGGILAWWALSFSQAEERRLWMVPLGLVVFGAPLIACLSVSLSPDARLRFLPRREAARPPPRRPLATEPESASTSVIA
ncbi:hypothetical protein AXF42_Ash008502 [Apostasia shenzhenica]|uniref:Uncharacterized protein n=1 Tax=Apostasia shenzhenica TaxID=1088818 RepID=A0A2I0AY14_9ASPA|nr:hypothetical protein AXF42_Ash008502 [Apostasia shenzhenica]